MKRYEKAVEDRKVLVKRLEELTGQKAVYTRLPRLAFDLGPYSVEKEGTLVAGDSADEEILSTLQEEGLIGAEIRDGEQERQDALAAAYVPVEQQDSAYSMAGTQGWEPEAQTEETEDEDPALLAPASAMGRSAEEETASEDAPENGEADGLGFPMDVSVSFPLAKHTPATLANLVCMVYSRGSLLSKATGGVFGADKSLVDAMLDAGTFVKNEDLVRFLEERKEGGERLEGLSFEEGKVNLDGFRAAPDAEHAQVFMRLAARMNRMATTQRRVQAKEVDEQNEKYALRIWLVRLGMNGADCKTDRKVLMKNLSGHAAFRTDAEKEKWMARQAAKKQALKELKAQAEAEQDEATERAGA